MTEKEIIEILKLEPLPGEGGFFRQTYKSKTLVNDRSVSTAIYYFITEENFSALHLVPQDEMFHFYLGHSVEMLQITEGGEAKLIQIGKHLKNGEQPQVLAPGNVWQGTRLVPGGKWALLGCTVSPGFEFADFKMKTRAEFIRQFPQHEKLITRFTHG